MLTVKINDSDLEKRITEKARTFGKSTQEFVNELLNNALPPESKDELSYQHLSPAAHGYIIDHDIENISIDNSMPFSEVKDTADYVERLRENVWRKK